MGVTIFLLSAAVLLHEVTLLRVLAMAWWHHAASLVVAVALLGFGVAGTLLALVPALKREATVRWCGGLYALAIPLSVRAAAAVDFNVLEVGWDPSQWLRLLALQAIFFVPFLIAALGISTAIALASRKPGRVYALNLIGSGLGALIAPLFLAWAPPAGVLHVAVLTAAAAAIAGPGKMLRVWGLAAGLTAFLLGGEGLPMADQKDLPSAPPSREIRETYIGGLGLVQRVSVPGLHYAPGLSMLAPHHPNKQEALYVDGHLVGAVDRDRPDYLEHTVGALPFLFLEAPRTLYLGVGAEMARATDIVELNADLLDAAEVTGVAQDPRTFLETTQTRFDLIVHHLPGLHAAAETPLLTVEALALALSRTTADGGVALNASLTTPPRAGLKLLATAERVTPHVIAVRNPHRLCVFLRHRAATAWEREDMLEFCRENGFDPVRPVGWRLEEPHHVTDTPLLEPGPDYPYDVRPATDARPYFFKFFRWSRLGDLFDAEQTSFVQWPYVALLVALLQVVLLSLVLMGLPLALSRAARAPVLLFCALGLGFMLLEMSFLQRAMVRIGSPVHAVSAVLGGFLIGSGMGSLVGERLGRPLRAAALAVIALAPAGYFLLPGAPWGAALVCAVVAFPMGIPFPAALSRLEDKSVPWALAWNGCASVAATAGAPLLSSTFGIPATAGAALALYALIALRSR